MSASDSESFDREYGALRTGGALVDLAGWSSISITGGDRQAFVHNFCTNDVRRLVPGTSCEAFITNVKGRIVGHGLIDCRHSELVFVGAPSQGPRLVEHLDRYVIREDVKLRDTTGERNYFLTCGNTRLEIPHESISWNFIGRNDTKLLELRPQDVSPAVHALIGGGLVLVRPEAFTAIRIEAGMPLFGVDFDSSNFPQEVARDKEAISFTKGCYLGQETVARIDALGHVNQKIAGIRFFANDLPQPGAKLTRHGADTGSVTSAAFSPSLGAPIALAMVRREANLPGTRLESGVGDCEVIALPVST